MRGITWQRRSLRLEPSTDLLAERGERGNLMLAAASVLWIAHPNSHSSEKQPMQSVSLKSAGPLAMRSLPVAFHQKRRRRRHVVLPKREVFPTPTPLSSEERALLAFAKRPPKEIPPELTGLDRPITPIRIAAIEIKPLDQITPPKEN